MSAVIAARLRAGASNTTESKPASAASTIRAGPMSPVDAIRQRDSIATPPSFTSPKTRAVGDIGPPTTSADNRTDMRIRGNNTTPNDTTGSYENPAEPTIIGPPTPIQPLFLVAGAVIVLWLLLKD